MPYNEYCKVDEMGFAKFTLFGTVRYKILPDNLRFATGDYYLWAYKSAYLTYHRNLINNVAREERVPVILLAGVAASEVGGAPDRLKSMGVLQFRQLIVDSLNGDNSASNATSVGLIAMQIRVAAETIGLDPKKLTMRQQDRLATCLLSDSFNIRAVAQHLRKLIFFDNSALQDTVNLTDEQIILAVSRYNRGTERKKADFMRSISAPSGDPIREYSSYGRRIIEKKETIAKIMRGY